MPMLATPPQPPKVIEPRHASLDRFHFRQWQMFITTITIFITAWICTFGWIPAILALMVAKHVLVAILIMGLGVDARERWYL